MKQNHQSAAAVELVIPSSVDFPRISDPLGEVWVSIKELIAMGRGERKVQMKIASGEWRSRTVRQGKRGRPMREVALSSLPEDLQRRYLAMRSAQSAVTSEPSDQIEDPKSEIGNLKEEKDLDTLKAEHRLIEVLKRFSTTEREAFLDEARRLMGIVVRYVALPAKRELVSSAELEVDGTDRTDRTNIKAGSGQRTYEFTPAVLALCEEAKCTNEVILSFYKSRQHVVRKGGQPRVARAIAPRTLDGWSRRVKKDGLLVFLPRVSNRTDRTDRTNAGDGRLAKISPAAGEWLEQRWKHYPTATQCYYRWQQAAIKHKWRIPAFAWLARRYQGLSPVEKVSIFLGDAVYTAQHKPFLPRTAEDLSALQLLCGDHQVLDVLCWSEKLKALVRLWLTGWQCVRTGLIWGWHLDYTPSSTTIGCAYANGVRTFGAQPPAREGFQVKIYVDNGKDYKSKSINGEIEVHKNAAAIEGGLELLLTTRGVGLAQDFEVGQFFSRNYNGREKPIERTWRDVADFIQNEFFDRGWCGRNTKDKPQAFRDLYQRHVKAIKHGRESPFPQEPEVRAAVAECIYKYNTSKHTRTMLGGKTIVPIAELQRLYTTRFEISDQTLALLTMKPTSGVLKKNGVVALGSSYWHAELSKYKGRKDASGKPLRMEVRYTDDDYSTVWVVCPDGAICEAQRVEVSSVLHPNKESLRAVATRIREERDLIKNASLLNQSIWRGESVEDRIAAQLEPEVEEEIRIAVAAGGAGAGFSSSQPPARVHLLHWSDRKRLGGPAAVRPVTVGQVRDTPTDESIFEEPASGGVRMWDHEED